MRIGLDVRMLALDAFRTRGMGRYVRCLLDELLHLDREREYVLLTADSSSNCSKHNLSCVPLGGMPSFSKRGLWTQHVQFPLRLITKNLPLIHFLFAEIAPLWCGPNCSAILTVHDFVRFEQSTSSRKASISKTLYRRTLQSAVAIITVSHYVNEQVSAFVGDTGLPPVFTIHHGARSNQFHPVDRFKAISFVQDRYGIQAPYLLYTGGYDTRKQVAQLVQAYSALVNESALPHLLVLAGRMKASASFVEVIHQIAECKLFGRVVFTDYVTDEELLYLYNGADVFVFPSASEGFGLPLLEAMACGTPIIAFRNTAIPEVVDNAGILIADGDWDAYVHALLCLLSDDAKRHELKMRGLERSKMFTWEKTAQQTLGVYSILTA